MIAVLLAVPGAFASACCMGATSDVPAVLGRCERLGAAMMVGGAVELGRWDDTTAWRATSDEWVEGTGTLAAAWRWARWGQVSVGVPLVVSDRNAPGVHSAGGGLGDVTVGVRLDPIEEGSGPVPIFDAGLVLPTGRSWIASDDPLLADVTGEGVWQPWLGVGVEHTLGTWPLRARVSWRGVPGTDVARLGLSAGAARYFGSHWTVAGSWSFEWRPENAVARDGVDLSVVYGVPGRWRVWVSAGTDVSVPAFGRNTHGEARASGGVLFTAR